MPTYSDSRPCIDLSGAHSHQDLHALLPRFSTRVIQRARTDVRANSYATDITSCATSKCPFFLRDLYARPVNHQAEKNLWSTWTLRALREAPTQRQRLQERQRHDSAERRQLVVEPQASRGQMPVRLEWPIERHLEVVELHWYSMKDLVKDNDKQTNKHKSKRTKMQSALQPRVPVARTLPHSPITNSPTGTSLLDDVSWYTCEDLVFSCFKRYSRHVSSRWQEKGNKCLPNSSDGESRHPEKVCPLGTNFS